MREVTGSTRYVKYAECEPGQKIVHGTYVGQREGEYGIEHEFNEGFDTVVLGGRGHLNWALAKVKPGEKVLVEYAGTEKLAKGKFKGKDVHKFKVFIDDNAPADTGDVGAQDPDDDNVPF